MRESIRFLENPAYGYAVGRVRALETRLLDRPRYDRLIRADGPADFARVLADTAYADAVAGDSLADFAACLARARAANRSFLAGYAADPWLTALYRVGADFHNLRRLARARLTGSEPAAPALDYGGAGLDELSGRLEPAGRGAAPDRLRDRVVALLARKPGPAGLDYALDGLEQAELAAELSPSPYLSGWCRLRADSRNLLSTLRLRGTELEQALLAGGNVPVRTWHELAGAEPAAYQQRLRGTELEPAAAAVEQFLATGRGDRVSRLAREPELRFLHQARFAVLGHEPVACYYLFTENEIGNLGRLHAAKSAGRPPEECAELVALAS